MFLDSLKTIFFSVIDRLSVIKPMTVLSAGDGDAAVPTQRAQNSLPGEASCKAKCYHRIFLCLFLF